MILPTKRGGHPPPPRSNVTGVLPIEGPDKVEENNVAVFDGKYETDSPGWPQSWFEWSCVPTEVGVFKDLRDNKMAFIPFDVEEDQDVEIWFSAISELNTFSTRKSLTVLDQPGPSGWVSSWGGGGEINCHGLDTDSEGNLFVTGMFLGEVDFNSGIGSEIRDAGDSYDIYLTSFTIDGEFRWVQTWEGPGIEYDGYATPWNTDATNIAVNDRGSIFISSVYFDPSSSVMRSDGGFSQPASDFSLRMFQPDGGLAWEKTWNANIMHTVFNNFYWIFRIFDIDTDPDGNVYIAFSAYDTDSDETVDLDPGPETDEFPEFAEQAALGWLKLDNSGEVIDKKIFDIDLEQRLSCEIEVDTNGDIYFLGDFDLPVEIDSSLNLIPDSTASMNRFFCRYDPDGNLVWANSLPYHGRLEVKENQIYLFGNIDGNTDFDPGTARHEINPMGEVKAYVCSLNQSGEFEWVQMSGMEGGTGNILGSIDEDGNIYIVGFYTAESKDTRGAKPLRTYTTCYDPDGNEVWNTIWDTLTNGDMKGIGRNIGILYSRDHYYLCGGILTSANPYPMLANETSSYMIRSYAPADLNPGDGVYYHPHRFGDSQFFDTTGLFLMQLSDDGSW